MIKRPLSTIESHYKVVGHMSKGEAKKVIQWNNRRIDTSKINTVTCKKLWGIVKKSEECFTSTMIQ